MWLLRPVHFSGIMRSKRYNIRNKTSACSRNLCAFHKCRCSKSSSNSPRSRSLRIAATPPCTTRGQFRTCAIASASHCGSSTTDSRKPSSSKNTMFPQLCKNCKHGRTSSSHMPTAAAMSFTRAKGSTKDAVMGKTPSSPLVPSAHSSNSSRSCTHRNGCSWPKMPPLANASATSRSMHRRSSAIPWSTCACALSTGKKQRSLAALTTTCCSTPGTRSIKLSISS
mmetsp:Transcript_113614/g.328085  ORF Transcript_113614/g.328085 Transcript_113614/m.328085 type:complete len:225 (+) Transcript_113614:653-1327(+)